MEHRVKTTPGATLRRWRVLRRMKQAHAAEWLGVSQSTVSRWEAGTLPVTSEALARIEALYAARLDSAADSALQRLVTHDSRAVHLVCDHTHRLLACSASRAAEFSSPLSVLMGVSLWPFATEAIVARRCAMPDGMSSVRRRLNSIRGATTRQRCRFAQAAADGRASCLAMAPSHG
jgi:transcriptional regulator with XRE-family HTH domain